MKIMHLGDLHIGKTIHQQSLLEDQQKLLSQIVDKIDEEKVDIVVIAGDIYDRSIPSKEAMHIYESFLLAVNIERKIPVLAVSGNHDGAERLGHGKSYFTNYNYYLSTAVEDCFKPVIFDDVHFYLVPYIDAAYARAYFNDDSIRTHHDTYYMICNEISKNLDHSKTNILISHLFVAGGKETGSERELVIGTIENVNVTLFDEFDYVLLGHLHTPDAIKHPRVYYSGSLMRYSFSEIGQRKGYRILDTEAQTMFFKPLKIERNLEVGIGSFKDAEALKLNVNQNAYLKLELSDMETISEPMAKLKQIYPNLLELKPIFKKDIQHISTEDVTRLDISELIQKFYEQITDENMSELQINTIQNLLKESGELE